MTAASKTVPQKRVKAPPPKSVRPPRKAAPVSALSKLDQMVVAMRGAKGASVMDLMEITGWQMHSVRGAIAGALKKKRGLAVTSKKIGETRIYRIEGKA